MRSQDFKHSLCSAKCWTPETETSSIHKQAPSGWVFWTDRVRVEP